MKAEDEYIKQILVGLQINIVQKLDKAAEELHLPRSQIVREAIDIWLRAYERAKEAKDGSSDKGSGSSGGNT